VSRPLRVEYAGALNHITARGNERKPIFRDEFDRSRFLALIARVVARGWWRLYAYCLMENHYHLLLETTRPELIRGVQQLNGSYAQGFNRRHGRSGHLFGGRYHAILVERDRHLLEVARYIVLNPVRAGICEAPEDYRWSSYRATIGLESEPPGLAVRELLELFGSDASSASRHYQSFVADGIEADPWRSLRGQIYLGSKAFAAQAARRGRLEIPDAEVPRVQQDPVPPTLTELFAAHGEKAIVVAYRAHGYRLRELAKHLGIHYSTVSRRLQRIEGDAC
jgi:putative transposase